MEVIVSHNLTPVIKLKIQSHWYAVYNKLHHEKKILEQLQKEILESNLPLHTTICQCSHRKKKVTKPLFRCYFFEDTTTKAYHIALNVSGVDRDITFEGKVLPITKKQLIKITLEHDFETIDVTEKCIKVTV